MRYFPIFYQKSGFKQNSPHRIYNLSTSPLHSVWIKIHDTRRFSINWFNLRVYTTFRNFQFYLRVFFDINTSIRINTNNQKKFKLFNILQTFCQHFKNSFRNFFLGNFLRVRIEFSDISAKILEFPQAKRCPFLSITHMIFGIFSDRPRIEFGKKLLGAYILNLLIMMQKLKHRCIVSIIAVFSHRCLSWKHGCFLNWCCISNPESCLKILWILNINIIRN